MIRAHDHQHRTHAPARPEFSMKVEEEFLHEVVEQALLIMSSHMHTQLRHAFIHPNIIEWNHVIVHGMTGVFEGLT